MALNSGKWAPERIARGGCNRLLEDAALCKTSATVSDTALEPKNLLAAANFFPREEGIGAEAWNTVQESASNRGKGYANCTH